MLLRSLRSIAVINRQTVNHLSTSRMTSNANSPMETLIRQKLTESFFPNHLEIINESYMHNVPKGSETHFKVLVVSSKFDSLSLLQRHRLVNEVLQDELKNGVHALSIVAKTPVQWDETPSKSVDKSPACKGGFGR